MGNAGGRNEGTGAGVRTIELPDSLTIIGNGVFMESGLSAVTIPKNVTEIGDGVFSRCKRLPRIDAAPENPAYVSIVGVLFDRRDNALVAYPTGASGAYTIPDGTQRICAVAFWGSARLTAVTFPESLTSIGEEIFADSLKLKMIRIPEGVVTTSKRAFSHTKNFVLDVTEGSYAAQYAEEHRYPYGYGTE